MYFFAHLVNSKLTVERDTALQRGTVNALLEANSGQSAATYT
jgi:hypothetical protein